MHGRPPKQRCEETTSWPGKEKARSQPVFPPSTLTPRTVPKWGLCILFNPSNHLFFVTLLKMLPSKEGKLFLGNAFVLHNYNLLDTFLRSIAHRSDAIWVNTLRVGFTCLSVLRQENTPMFLWALRLRGSHALDSDPRAPSLMYSSYWGSTHCGGKFKRSPSL